MLGQQTEEPQRGRTLSSFVGREEQLALALHRWNAAANGSGEVLLVAGEAGIGKTRLLSEIAANVSGARQSAATASVARHFAATVFARDVEAVGGVILDLSAALARTSAP